METSTENIIIIAATVALTAALLILSHWIVPRYLLRFLRWVDDIIPADQSSFVAPVAKFTETVLGIAIVMSAGFTIASQLGVDMSGVLDTAEDGGAVLLEWILARALVVGIILATAFLAIRAINRITAPLIQQYLTRRGDADEESSEVDKRTRTLQGVVSNTLTVVIITTAFFMILSEIGINITPILAGAGVVGIAVGLGAQSLIRDIIAGVFIMLEDQYRIGDVAKVAGVSGIVEDINLRRTTLRDWDYIQHVIPNGEIGVASNYTKEKSRVNLNIEVAYKEDLDRVMDVIRVVGEGMSADPEWGPLILDPLKPVRVQEFGASGIAIKVIGDTKPIYQWDVAGEFRRRIKRVFDDEGIEIPFPHVTLYWGSDSETPVPRLMDMREEKNRGPSTGPKPGDPDGDP